MSMKTTVQWIGEMSFAGITGSGHTVTMDGAAEAGGRNIAPRPMEMVLAGLGACSSFDVVKMLRQAGQDVHSLHIDIEAQRADTEPAVFTRIHGHFVVRGHKLDEQLVRAAITASAEQHSSVSKMLEKTAQISYDYVIEESEQQ